MKRKNNITEEIATYGNINASIDVVLRGTKRKESSKGRYIIQNKEKIISELSKQLLNGTFRLGEYREKKITDGYKERTVQSLSYIDRIAVNAVMTIFEKYADRTFIRTSGASIKRRGATDLFKYIQKDIKENPNETKYCYKMDVKKFYSSIDQRLMKECVRYYFKDKKLLLMIDNFIEMMPKGLSIGLRASQCLGNLFLSHHVDHIMKDRERTKYYYRYCDDIVVLSNSKKELWSKREIILNQLSKINLEIKDNEKIFPTKIGIDYLGYVIYPTHSKLRKRNKKRFIKRYLKVKSKKRKIELIASFYGQAKHADCMNLFKTLTGRTMVSFAELGLKYTPEDGKKIFKGGIIPLRQLVNLLIEVNDCEFDIKTKEGEGRCIVAFMHNGQEGKFFTASKEMINILKQIKEIDKFPFKTTIQAEVFDRNKTKYIFT